MSRMIGRRSTFPAPRALSPAVSLSLLRSPSASGSNANWLERVLLGYMEPEHRWAVAIATVSHIPQIRLERVDGSPVLVIDVNLVEMEATVPPSSPSRKVDESRHGDHRPTPTTQPGRGNGRRHSITIATPRRETSGSR